MSNNSSVGVALRHGNWTIKGESIGSMGTCVMIPELKLCFDLGIVSCIKDTIKYKYVAVSHGHCDHIGGLHYHARMRACKHMPLPTYFLPECVINNFNSLYNSVLDLDACSTQKLAHKPEYNIHSVDAGLSFQLNKQYNLQCYNMLHVIPTYGYVVSSSRNKLKNEYKGLASRELRDLKKHTDVFEVCHVNEIAFSGDTSIRGVLREKAFTTAKVLIIECTFLDDEVTPEQATERGHVHVQDIVNNESSFLNECIVLTHFSARYSPEQIVHHISNAGFSDTFFFKLKILLQYP